MRTSTRIHSTRSHHSPTQSHVPFCSQSDLHPVLSVHDSFPHSIPSQSDLHPLLSVHHFQPVGRSSQHPPPQSHSLTHLREAGGSLNELNGHGKTPLQMAASVGNKEMTRALVAGMEAAKLDLDEGAHGCCRTAGG